MQRTIQATIRPGEQSGYVAECPQLSLVTQGTTLDEVAANLKEAVELALEGEDMAEPGLAAEPVEVVMLSANYPARPRRMHPPACGPS